MKRLQIMIDEDLDRALDAQADRQHTSKAALIRSYVRAGLNPLPPFEEDPLSDLVGSVDNPSGSVDDVVYR
jgi:hypothetical protein